MTQKKRKNNIFSDTNTHAHKNVHRVFRRGKTQLKTGSIKFLCWSHQRRNENARAEGTRGHRWRHRKSEIVGGDGIKNCTPPPYWRARDGAFFHRHWSQGGNEN